MEKRVLFLLSVVSCAAVLIMTGCKKKDTYPPFIKLNGTNPMTVSLNSSSPDPGATASDDVDASVQVITSGTLDINTKGDYIVTYSATDNAGNTSTVSRTFHVVNDAEPWAGNYYVTDSVIGVMMNHYNQVITTDNHIDNRIHFNQFDNYSSNSGIYGTVIGTDSLVISSQAAIGIDSPAQNHTFSGAGLKSGNNFWLMYQNINNTTSITVMDSAVFVKY